MMTETMTLTADQIDANTTLLRMIDALRRQAEQAAGLDSETTEGLIARVGQMMNDIEIMTTGEIE